MSQNNKCPETCWRFWIRLLDERGWSWACMHGQRQVFSVQLLKNNYLKTPYIFLFPWLAGFGDEVGSFGLGSFFSGPLAGITLLWGTRRDHWPYNSLRDLMGTFYSAHFKRVHLGHCPSALGATLISLPIFSCLRNGSFKHCHQLANSYISHSLFLPTSGRSWLYSQLPGQVDFDTFEQWFSWQWLSPTILKKLNCLWRGDPAVSQ